MTIRNKKAFMDALWDWGFLDKCFGNTGIRVSDIDGMVERNGHVLFIEAKPPDKTVSTGQRRAFEALTKKGFMVLIIWGRTNEPEYISIWYPNEEAPRPPKKANVSDLQDFVTTWFRWADAS